MRRSSGDFYLPALQGSSDGLSATVDWANLSCEWVWHPEILGWAFALRRRGRCSLPEQKPAHVAGDVCEADFGASSGDADGADEQPHAVLLVGKDMLDAGPFPRAGGVGLLAWRRHRLAGRLAEVHLRDQPAAAMRFSFF